MWPHRKWNVWNFFCLLHWKASNTEYCLNTSEHLWITTVILSSPDFKESHWSSELDYVYVFTLSGCFAMNLKIKLYLYLQHLSISSELSPQSLMWLHLSDSKIHRQFLHWNWKLLQGSSQPIEYRKYYIILNSYIEHTFILYFIAIRFQM